MFPKRPDLKIQFSHIAYQFEKQFLNHFRYDFPIF